jgi:hypothetical protein
LDAAVIFILSQLPTAVIALRKDDGIRWLAAIVMMLVLIFIMIAFYTLPSSLLLLMRRNRVVFYQQAGICWVNHDVFGISVVDLSQRLLTVLIFFTTCSPLLTPVAFLSYVALSLGIVAAICSLCGLAVL